MGIEKKALLSFDLWFSFFVFFFFFFCTESLNTEPHFCDWQNFSFSVFSHWFDLLLNFCHISCQILQQLQLCVYVCVCMSIVCSLIIYGNDSLAPWIIKISSTRNSKSHFGIVMVCLTERKTKDRKRKSATWSKNEDGEERQTKWNQPSFIFFILYFCALLPVSSCFSPSSSSSGVFLRPPTPPPFLFISSNVRAVKVKELKSTSLTTLEAFFCVCAAFCPCVCYVSSVYWNRCGGCRLLFDYWRFSLRCCNSTGCLTHTYPHSTSGFI